MGLEGFETQLIGLAMVAAFVAIFARRVRVPYTIAMVLTGLVVGLLQLGPSFTSLELEPHLILVTFLPGLIFEAAYHLDLAQLRANIRIILMLAIPGILLSMVIIGLLLNQMLGLSLAEALLFGILISATDPIAVIALFKEMGVDKRLSVIVEGESLLNDGVAIVLYTILLGVATGEKAFSLTESLTSFVVTVAGGAALGLVVGLVVGELMKRTEDHLVDIALTTILAYGTYILAAEVLHEAVSPVIAVVTGAIYVGNYGHYGSGGRPSPTSTITIIHFWEFAAFLINSAIFLLIGLEMKFASLARNLGPIIVAIGATLIARAVVVYLMRVLVNRGESRMPNRWWHVLFWGGLRGAVSLALVLSLPAQLARRETLEVMAFGYVFFSLVVQGLTMRPLLRWLGLTRVSQAKLAFEKHRARVVKTHATIHAIDDLHNNHLLPGPICHRLRDQLVDQSKVQWEELEKMAADDPMLLAADVRFVQREISRRQKQALMNLLRRGAISEEAYEEMAQEIDEVVERTYQTEWVPPSVLVHGPRAYLPDISEKERGE